VLTAEPRGPEDVNIVAVDPDSEDRPWPYTSRERRFETVTLPINVVVRGNDTRVRWFLMTGRDADWNESEAEWQGVGGAEIGEAAGELDWYQVHGATRYAYVLSTRNPYGGWVEEAYQPHDGDYFGTRYHIRAYTGGRENTSWTAVQARHEHWDWFRLRHTVGSTADARRYVEQSFYGSPAVARVERERYANGGPSDADGWVTVATMRQPAPPEPGETGPEPGPGNRTANGSESGSGAGPGDGVRHATGPVPSLRAWGLLAALLWGTALSFEAVDVRGRFDGTAAEGVEVPDRLLALFAVALLTMPSLRWASIVAERTVRWLPPKLVAGLGYLAIAIGLPAAVLLLARGTRADRAAPLAAGGIGIGILLDYVLVGITPVPVPVIPHRLAVVLTVGQSAAAGTRLRTDRRREIALPVAAALLWVGVLVRPLLDLL
jgi:hypothetical protein